MGEVRLERAKWWWIKWKENKVGRTKRWEGRRKGARQEERRKGIGVGSDGLGN